MLCVHDDLVICLLELLLDLDHDLDHHRTDQPKQKADRNLFQLRWSTCRISDRDSDQCSQLGQLLEGHEVDKEELHCFLYLCSHLFLHLYLCLHLFLYLCLRLYLYLFLYLCLHLCLRQWLFRDVLVDLFCLPLDDPSWHFVLLVEVQHYLHLALHRNCEIRLGNYIKV